MSLARPQQDNQRGAALVTVLMIVAAMAMVAVLISQNVNAATHRSAALSQQSQARLYAQSAEALVKARLSDIFQTYQGKVVANAPGFSEPAVFPLNAGSLSLSLQDQANCFNINSLVSADESRRLSRDEQAHADFVRLAEIARIERSIAIALADALVDWMDSDSSPGVSGAENAYYTSLSPSYRTSGQPIATLSEINAIRGFDGEVRAALQPYLCALPDMVGGRAIPFNINTMTPDQAPLLLLAFPTDLSVIDAKTLISARPALGWPSVEEFLKEPKLALYDVETIRRDRLAVTTSHLSARAAISYRDQSLIMDYLLAVANGQPISVVYRERVG